MLTFVLIVSVVVFLFGLAGWLTHLFLGPRPRLRVWGNRLMLLGAAVFVLAFVIGVWPVPQIRVAANRDRVPEAEVETDPAVTALEAKIAELEAKLADDDQPEVAQAQEPEAGASETGCRSTIWWEEAQADNADVAALIADLDRDFVLDEGGQWSHSGYKVPAGSVFWTDLFDARQSLPNGVKAVRTQGGWGVYATLVAYEIPSPNGGGRFMRLCGESVQVPAEPEAETPTEKAASEQSAAPASSQTNCLAKADLNNITGSQDPVKAFNSYYESAGWEYGAAIEAGGTAKAGGYFLGTFQEGNIPSGATNLAKGFVWSLAKDVKVPNGGRWVVACK